MAGDDRTPAEDLVPARAIVDIGSNTVRLVVYGGPARAPVVLHNEKVTARLGRGLAETGLLAPKAVDAALAALARYRALLRLKGVPDEAVEVVATAAVRDASDGEAFLARVAALGFAPRLLSGTQEALASAMGVIGAFPGARGVVADLGGGSLELVDVAEGAGSHGVSLPLGTLRLPPLVAVGEKPFTRALGAMLRGAGWTLPEPGGTLYLVGGTFRALARFAQGPRHWPSDDPHGLELPAREGVKLARGAMRAGPEAMAGIPGLTQARAGSLPDAALLLLALLEQLKPGKLVFSAWGLREGLLFQSLDPDCRAEDPLMAGVAAYAERHGAQRGEAAGIARWIAAGLGPARAAPDEPLRRAATLLCLALATVEPNLRAETALGWALRKRWIGITTRQRTMLAAGLLASAGRPEPEALGGGLASAADIDEARSWGLATRLCRRLSAGAPQVLADSTLAREAGQLVLTLGGTCATLLNDAVTRDLKALAAHLGLKAQVVA